MGQGLQNITLIQELRDQIAALTKERDEWAEKAKDQAREKHALAAQVERMRDVLKSIDFACNCGQGNTYPDGHLDCCLFVRHRHAIAEPPSTALAELLGPIEAFLKQRRDVYVEGTRDWLTFEKELARLHSFLK